MELIPDNLIKNGQIIQKDLITHLTNNLQLGTSTAYQKVKDLVKSEKIKKISGKTYKVLVDK